LLVERQDQYYLKVLGIPREDKKKEAEALQEFIKFRENAIREDEKLGI
jgi:hypothetical protein